MEVYIRNEAAKRDTEQSKYAIHKTIAAIKAGNMSGRPASTAKETPVVGPYAGFSCPVCQHGDDQQQQQQQQQQRAQVPYFRSENLDSIIYLCHQASNLADREVSSSFLVLSCGTYYIISVALSSGPTLLWFFLSGVFFFFFSFNHDITN